MSSHGSELNSRIDLVMDDGQIFPINLCYVNKILFGLNKMFEPYSIQISYFIFFNNVGNFTFNLIVSSTHFVHIRNSIGNMWNLFDSSENLSSDHALHLLIWFIFRISINLE